MKPDFTHARWIKASDSEANFCVEIAFSNGWVGVRDSKNGDGGQVLVFNEDEWSAFLKGARAGEFEIDRLSR